MTKNYMSHKTQRHTLFGCALILLLLLQSCGGKRTATVFIQNEKKYYDLAPDIKKIIAIEPEFLWVDQKEEIEQVVLDSENLSAQFQQKLVSNAAVNGIELEIWAPNTLERKDVVYFNQLLPLKTAILTANSLQELESEKYKSSGYFAFTLIKAAYRQELEFDPDFESLAKKYGTPYFSLNALLTYPKTIPLKSSSSRPGPRPVKVRPETLYYHVLVDVVRSEIIYREVRLYPKSLDIKSLQDILEHSYKMLKNK